MCGEAPSFSVASVTHQELKGQGSALLTKSSNKQAAGSCSESQSPWDVAGSVWDGFCMPRLVIVSVSPTTFRRQISRFADT